MKLLLSAFLCLFSFLSGQSQTVSFAFNDYLTLPHSRNLHTISGLEYIPQRQEWQLAGDRGQYFLFRNIHQLTDWACRPDSSFQTGLYLEAVRYDAASDTYFFTVENNNESFVGYRKHAIPQTGESFERLPLPHSLPVKKNKGVEALALTTHYLWVAPEAGSLEEARVDNSLIHFYRYKKVNGSVVFDAEFSYQIDRNVCPSEALGGISEIIAIPGDETRLLVLERCYENSTKTVTAKLYEARIDEATHQLIKQKEKPAFDFNGRNSFHPDNVEAMTWGEDLDGKKILVVMTDDNASKNQWTQIILLELQIN
ncbi:esterase-like activity of phytase family protein [Larkinella rosea]|uniref:Esterase-like activity of phytase family protein n=1 Tax=Larkinella rosea TaxID=2025312 RepID=A0A3P1BMN8_9BACT|nr:esterase-like activity of phytase family protein [Larkinella rosea]RRB02305.1 esterase-like activity of phytase family protein [Larkinella rosea]